MVIMNRPKLGLNKIVRKKNERGKEKRKKNRARITQLYFGVGMLHLHLKIRGQKIKLPNNTGFKKACP